MITALIFIVVLSLLVFVHELGHFYTARRFGVKAQEFGFGFPPRAIGCYRDSKGKWQRVLGNKSADELDAPGTVYSLNWLPIGGFVNIKGENGAEKGAADSFASKKIWQRTIILAAGVIMNIVLAWFLFSAGYLFGLPQSTEELGRKAIVSDASVLVAEVLPGKPAQMAGIQANDKIISINGQPLSTYQELQTALAPLNGSPVALQIERGGEILELTATPSDSGSGRATIGVSVYSSGLVRYPFFNALWEGAKTTVILLKEIFLAFANLIGGLFAGQAVGDDFAGPVGIANITGQAARLGFTYLLQFMALLSLNLALINILPFPALDGGRILFVVIEKFKGKPVKQSVEAWIHTIGFWLLLALIVVVTYKDIGRLF